MITPEARTILDKEAVLTACAGRWLDFYGQFMTFKRQGGEYRAACLLHGGNGLNFAVNAENGEWYCHTGCKEGGDALRFLERKDDLSFLEALQELAQFTGTTPTPAPRRNGHKNGPARRIVSTYNYTDEDGVLLFQAVRYEPKGFSQRAPTDTPGAWTYSLSGVRHVLYALPEVLDAVAAVRAVYLTEGEKDADALRALGLCATTSPMGAGKWEDAYTETLCGAGVVVLPDNDAPGRAHAQKVAAALHGRAKRVRVVELPNLPERGDAFDWIEAGGTKEALLALVKTAPDWNPALAPPLSDPPAAPSAPPKRKPIAERVVDLADVEAPGTLPLLFGQYLIKGATHWMTGQTGIGKSTFVYNLVCALAEGSPLWGMECEQTRILYVDMESGDVGRALKVERLYLGAERVRGQLLFLREPMRLPDELAELLAYVQAAGISLIIFDTARRCFSVKDENDNAEVYNRVVPVLDALKQIGVATLTLGHPAKNGNGSARGAGAQEDAGDVNLSLSMHRGEVSDADGILVLRVTKNRLLGLGVPPLYLKRIGNDQFEPVEMGAAAAGESLSAELTACGLVLRALGDQEDGQMRRAELERLAEEQHVSRATLGRVLPKMVSEGQIRQVARGVYGLPDPFADDNARP